MSDDNTNKSPSLDVVLCGFLEEAENPNHSTLMKWVRKYPQYAGELTEFAVARNLMEALPEPETSEDDTKRTLAYGKKAIQAIFAARKKGTSNK